MFERKILSGYGKSHASFGEILQGRLSNGNDFLVTLPIDLWSICNLTAIRRIGPLTINCDLYKSRRVTELLLEKLDIREGFEINIAFSRNIPIGKGLSSSTADMLSAVRALQEIFGFLLREKTICEIFTSIEPHDGLMYKSCVVYNHRKGELLQDLLYIPKYWIIVIELEGMVDTVEYNKNLVFDETLHQRYEALLSDLQQYFLHHDDAMIAALASKSTELYLQNKKDYKRQTVYDSSERFGPMGVINAHSGSCLGLLFPRQMSRREVFEKAHEINDFYEYPVFVTSTLNLLV